MTTQNIKDRLEYLRGEIIAERISYGEIAELQSLAEHIDAGDVLLLEWAGVLEQKDNLNIVTCGHCGRVFAHELNCKELTCPYCKITSDICDFPDLYSDENKNTITHG